MKTTYTKKELEDIRLKQSQAKEGIKNPMYGKKHSEDVKRKISQSCTAYHSQLGRKSDSDTPVSDNLYGR